MRDPDRWRFFFVGMIAGASLVCGVLAFAAAYFGIRGQPTGNRLDP